MDDDAEFHLDCTLTDGTSTTPVRIHGWRGARVADLRPQLEPFLREPTPALWCDGVRLGDDLTVGAPPLVQGCRLSTVPSSAGPGSARAGSDGRRPSAIHPGGLVLQVTAGPDAGAGLPCRRAPVVVGRGHGADLVVEDPTVSRRHLVVEPPPDPDSPGRVHDLGSVNGVLVAGTVGDVGDAGDAGDAGDGGTAGPSSPAAGVGRPLRVGEPVVAGMSTFEVRAPAHDPAVVRPDGLGHLWVQRSAVVAEPARDLVVHRLVEPSPPEASRPPWAQIALPLAVAVPTALIWRQPLLILVSLVAPLFFLGQHLLQARRRRRERDEVTATAARLQTEARARLLELMEIERRELEALHPDPGTIGLLTGARWAGGDGRGPRRGLWARTPEDASWLEVRLGTGRRPSRVRSEPRQPGPDPCAEPFLDRAPVTLDLTGCPSVGITGPTDAVRALARAVVVQLAALCSPHDLRLSVPIGSRAWSWAAALPHGLPDPDAAETEARDDKPGAAPRPVTVRIVDRLDPPDARDAAAEGVDRPRGAEGAEGPGGLSGPAARAPQHHPWRATVEEVVIHLGPSPAALPVGCRATVTVRADGTAVLARHGSSVQEGWTADGLGQRGAEELAAALAPCRVQGQAGRALPARVHLVDLLRDRGVDPLDADSVARAWSRPDGACRTPLGATRDGVWELDLDRDGPHVLVAGTTGAGKSQFLIAWVAGLAATYPPDEVTFVLVDYKGGAAFGAAASLPHVTGLVTDLDGALTRRLLDSLGAEVKRRERLFADHGVADLAGYRRAKEAAGGAAPPLPRLVVVVDEFRVLAEEIPQFVPGLVRLAAVGRSLGMHVVLATQRPAGVVTADIRANVNLRVALRVREPADSLDVVECPDAAALPPSRPGRAIVALPPGSGTEIQVATVLGTPRETPGGSPAGRGVISVVRRPTGPLDGPAPEPDRAGQAHGSTLPGLVAAVTDAWARHGGRAVRRPWCEPLPTRIPLSALLAEPGRSPGHVVLGRADHVQRQEQPIWTWNPVRPGHVAVVGAAGSGRTTALRTLALAACAAGHQVQVLDAGGALADLERVPGVGNVVAVEDAERAGRLLTALEPSGAAPAAGPVRGPGREPLSSDRPVTLLLVDGWEAVVAAWSDADRLPLVDRLMALLRGGSDSGVRVVAAGGRALLAGTSAAAFTDRILLPAADPADGALAGVPAALLAGHATTPGRALHVIGRDVVPVQWAFPDADARRRARTWGRSAPRFAPLPQRISLHDVGRLTPRGSGAGPVIGCTPAPVDRPDAGLLAARLPVSRSGTSVVLGRPGGGRSTALAAVRASLEEADVPCLLLGPDTFDDGDAAPGGPLTTRLRERPDTVVLVDDAEVLTPGPLEDLLLAHLAAGRGRGPAVPRLVAALNGSEAAGRYRGLVAELRAARCGLVLGGAQPGDGEVLGVRLPTGRATLPGRGVIVDRGRTATVQVGDPAGGAPARPGGVHVHPHVHTHDTLRRATRERIADDSAGGPRRRDRALRDASHGHDLRLVLDKA